MLEMDDIENGLYAPSDDMGDRERHLTTSLSNLRELTILITNQLGSTVDPENAIINKPKKQTGKKEDMLTGQQVTDDSTMGNRSLPRFAAKPGQPVTYSKPDNYLTKSRDFTGSSISKDNGSRNPDREKPMPEDFEEELGSDEEKFLGVVSRLAGDDDERKALSGDKVELLTLLEKLLPLVEQLKVDLKREASTTITPERTALQPKDVKSGQPHQPNTDLR